MAYSTPLLYIEQEPWLHILPAEPAIEPCFSIQRAYLPGFEDVVYIIGEHLAEQPIPCRRVIPLSTDQCPICQMLRHRNYTYQYLLPVVVHVRNEFIPVCCGKNIPLIVGDRTASYHSPADGTGATNNITFVQSTINLPKYFILDNEEVEYRRCRHQPRDCPPKRSQREHRRRSRPHRRTDELHTQERKRVEFKNLEVHNDTRESRSKSTRTPSPITFSRASTLAESPTPVRTDKATAILPQALSGSTKHSPTKSQRPASDVCEKRAPMQQGGYKCPKTESILSCSTDSTKLGIIPPYKLAVPRNPQNPPESRPRVIGRSYDATRKGGKMGWLRFWRR